MPDNFELLLIQHEVEQRFRPSNPITQAIAQKLAQTLFQQRRCEYLINFARSLPQRRIDQLPADKQANFTQNMKKLIVRLQALKRTSREYSAALGASTSNPA